MNEAELVNDVTAIVQSDMEMSAKARLIVAVVSRTVGKKGGRPPSKTGLNPLEPVISGDISDPDLISGSGDPDKEISAKTSKPVSYSPAFERAWKAYPRRQEKPKAFGVWKRIHRAHGGEDALCEAILKALGWQIPKLWSGDNVQFAPYFERYLKNGKWLDEPVSPPSAPSPYKKLG